MKPETVDINDAEGHLKELLKQVAEGTHIVLSEGDKPVAQLVPLGRRIAGLHAGAIWTSEDFDDPLPDEFWTDGK